MNALIEKKTGITGGLSSLFHLSPNFLISTSLICAHDSMLCDLSPLVLGPLQTTFPLIGSGVATGFSLSYDSDSDSDDSDCIYSSAESSPAKITSTTSSTV